VYSQGDIPFHFGMTERYLQGRRYFCHNFATKLVSWQRPLRYLKKKAGLIICNSIPTIRRKDCQNRFSGSWDTSAPSEQVRYDTKLAAMATSLEILEKEVHIDHVHLKRFHSEKIAKIGPADPEIICLREIIKN